MSSIIVGFETNFVRDLKETLAIAETNSQNFVVVPLFHPRNKRNPNNSVDRLTRSDMILESKEWKAHVVGKISEWIDLDSNDSNDRRNSEHTVLEEFSWACHLGLQAVIFPGLQTISNPNYAKIVYDLCSLSCHTQIWIRVPLQLALHHRTVDISSTKPYDGWEAWHHFRLLCDHHQQIGVAVELTEDLPDSIELIKRWQGEPVKAVILSTHTFLSNKSGCPVLSKRHQETLSILMTHKIHVILRGRSMLGAGDSNLLPYVQYIKFLFSRHVSTCQSSKSDGGYSSYRDYLQAPLQPLMDNLEAQIYETFEQDPVKYRQYELAITKRLLEVKERWKAMRGGDPDTGGGAVPTVHIMVVGAGRGPLVVCALSAACAVDVCVHIYAVEKNKNAVITLRNRCVSEVWTNVEVISSDMRKWSPPHPVDIMVSELLGSWGDNELSPECLDGVQAGLDRECGVSIPCNYTSFLSPISSSKLWTTARNQGAKALDIPYVVKMHSHFQVAPPQPVFFFAHPNRDAQIDNTRYTTLSFVCEQSCVIHGFAGTFESVLYDDVTISIRPETHSSGMFSWFPLFIPLAAPITVEDGDTFTVHVWRCVGDKKVWYEWGVTSPVVTRIQNSKGESYWIGL